MSLGDLRTVRGTRRRWLCALAASGLAGGVHVVQPRRRPDPGKRRQRDERRGRKRRLVDGRRARGPGRRGGARLGRIDWDGRRHGGRRESTGVGRRDRHRRGARRWRRRTAEASGAQRDPRRHAPGQQLLHGQVARSGRRDRHRQVPRQQHLDARRVLRRPDGALRARRAGELLQLRCRLGHQPRLGAQQRRDDHQRRRSVRGADLSRPLQDRRAGGAAARHQGRHRSRAHRRGPVGVDVDRRDPDGDAGVRAAGRADRQHDVLRQDVRVLQLHEEHHRRKRPVQQDRAPVVARHGLRSALRRAQRTELLLVARQRLGLRGAGARARHLAGQRSAPRRIPRRLPGHVRRAADGAAERRLLERQPARPDALPAAKR